jgi:ABC-2 type transport system ATP-binding protein
MGEKKAIIFSTHILEEVEAVCSRAIIIDAGRIVANGTPAELKQKSAHAGAVTVRFANGDAPAVTRTLQELSGGERLTTISESPVTLRIYPRKNAVRGQLAAAIGEIASRERWQIEELHTEEGRLDEVFRAITLPETAPRKS